MINKFQQISVKPGFMKHNGGVFFKKITNTKYQFKSTILKKHLNSTKITHGGYLASLIDSGSGTAVHRSVQNIPCITVSLELKFIAPTRIGDEIIGITKILKKTKTLIFINCELYCKKKIIASATGIWKILNKKPVELVGNGS